MVPVIIGAAVGLAGVALLRDNDKKQPDTEKRQVSEDYVMRQLNRAGKNLQKNYIETSDKRAEKIKNIVDIVNHLYFKRVIE